MTLSVLLNYSTVCVYSDLSGTEMWNQTSYFQLMWKL